MGPAAGAPHRVFLDTNVLVAAFATRGLCADVLRVVLAEHALLTSEAVLGELRRVLRTKLRAAPAVVAEVEALLREQTVVPAAAAALGIDVRDPSDRPILAAAIAARADVFVTGDHDLLSVARRSPIPIVDPRGFWTLVRGTA
jgi:putative PIN family toxin of toxin-antitoxin system